MPLHELYSAFCANTFLILQTKPTKMYLQFCAHPCTPTSSNLKFSTSFFSFLLLILCSFLPFDLIAQGTWTPTAPIAPPNGGFKIDGQVKANISFPGGDWIAGITGTGGFVLQPAGTATTTYIPVSGIQAKLIRDDYNSNTDLVFSGSAFADDPGTWKWTAGKAANKCDINNGMYLVTTDNNNNKWIIMGGDRYVTTGTSYIDFEFYQGILARTSGGTFTSLTASGGVFTNTGGRTEGDFVLSMEYTNGGALATVHYYRWELPSGSTAYRYVEHTIPSNSITGAALAYGATNSTTVDVPYGAFGATSYIPYSFVEAAVNIDELIHETNPCSSLSINTLFIKTKASDTYSAALKDFVEPQPVSFTFGSGGISYPAGPFCATGTISPTVSGTGTFSSNPATGISWVSTSTGEINLAASQPGTYTITFTYNAGGGCTLPASQQITIKGLPSASISGTNAVCKDASAPQIKFTGSGGTGPYSFGYTLNSGSGAGGVVTLTTAAGTESVTVQASTATAGTFTYTLSRVSDAYCSNNASGTAIVTVRPLPTASIGGSANVCVGAPSQSISFNYTGSGGTPLYSFGYTLDQGSGAGGVVTSTTTGSDVTTSVTQATTSAGTFTYTLTRVADQYCSNTASGNAIIKVYALPTVSINSNVASACVGGTPPVMSLTASGGVGPYTITYNINNGGTLTTVTNNAGVASLNVLTTTAGTFTYTLQSVQSSLGLCTGASTASATVVINSLPAASISGGTSVCKNVSAPSITFTGSYGIAPYTFFYKINNGTTTSVTTTSGNSVSVLAPTSSAGTFTYTLISVQDASSTQCSKAATESQTVIVNDLPTANAGSVDAQCYLASGNSITLNGAVQYGDAHWSVYSNPSSLAYSLANANSAVTAATVTGTSSGNSITFLLTSQSNTGCGTATSTVTLSINAVEGAPSVTYVAPTCDATTFTVTVNTPSSGTVYTIKDKNGNNISGVKVGSETLVAGVYTATSNSSFSFYNIPAGSGYRVTGTIGTCVSAPQSCGAPSGGSVINRVNTPDYVTTQDIILPDSKPRILAYPNPYNDKIRFVITTPEAGKGSLELYNLLGQKIRTVYQGYFNEGTQTFEVSIPVQQRSTLIYIVSLNGRQVSGKLLNGSR